MVNLNKVVALPSPRWKTKLAQSRQHVDINKSGLLLMTTSSLRLIEKYRLHYPVTAIRIYRTKFSLATLYSHLVTSYIENSDGNEAHLWSNPSSQPAKYDNMWIKLRLAPLGRTNMKMKHHLCSMKTWSACKSGRYLQSSQKTGTKQYWGHSSQATSKRRRVLVANRVCTLCWWVVDSSKARVCYRPGEVSSKLRKQSVGSFISKRRKETWGPKKYKTPTGTAKAPNAFRALKTMLSCKQHVSEAMSLLKHKKMALSLESFCATGYLSNLAVCLPHADPILCGSPVLILHPTWCLIYEAECGWPPQLDGKCEQ